MYFRCVCSCFYVVPFEQERAYTSASPYGIDYVHCFEQSQHLLMHVDLIGVVANFGTVERLVFEGIDLKHLITTMRETINHILS